ncbi:DUF3995 domain-containing protein [Flavobacterium sp. HBTb2-11-1]|uniref:DUF3995 domain-containing protein n=1 Tax=Flavobacterium sp. HBTb2-11-1 TaxID=2692212 RepID=UPI001367ADEF|nr:DUF3995 domain-containing protein [Flavobacterium sp. HBTb2-11-1]MXO05797.1 DUF3995 domain-containing protein [Flavobacterium sp. HBTb2-11-1]
MSIISLLLFLIFATISGIHFYWGFGGKWGSKEAVPTKDDETPLFTPGPISCFVVAVATLLFGVLYLIKFGFIQLSLPGWIYKYGFWLIISIFTLRAIGEFNYVGFFKKHKSSQFGVNDTKYYSPLCLLIGILTLVLELNN